MLWVASIQIPHATPKYIIGPTQIRLGLRPVCSAGIDGFKLQLPANETGPAAVREIQTAEDQVLAIPWHSDVIEFKIQ